MEEWIDSISGVEDYYAYSVESDSRRTQSVRLEMCLCGAKDFTITS